MDFLSLARQPSAHLLNCTANSVITTSQNIIIGPTLAWENGDGFSIPVFNHQTTFNFEFSHLPRCSYFSDSGQGIRTCDRRQADTGIAKYNHTVDAVSRRLRLSCYPGGGANRFFVRIFLLPGLRRHYSSCSHRLGTVTCASAPALLQE